MQATIFYSLCFVSQNKTMQLLKMKGSHLAGPED